MALLSPSVSRLFFVVSGIASLLGKGVAADDDHHHHAGGKVYTYGQSIPVTCLNRTIDSGEHITDDLGKMQYIPFPTCNETSLPLALRYGVTETVNCTVDSLPDELYHLLEYYVHSDVPMTCRVPTVPLGSSGSSHKDHDDDDDDDDDKEHEKHGETALDSDPAYTPLTFALQGTLQRSHLHMWTDMNVLVHNIASSGSAKKTKSNKKKNKNYVSPGYVVAGTAYSLPEFDGTALQKSTLSSSTREKKEKAVVAMSDAAREPWTAGHGTKVIRGEPLTFTFYVSWVEGGRGIGWPSGPSSLSPSAQAFADGSSSGSGAGSFFSRLFFFILAASVGGFAALHWERKRRSGWRGDGILGVPSTSAGFSVPRGKGPTGVVGFGNGGRINGYGGFSASTSPSPGGNGLTGKRD